MKRLDTVPVDYSKLKQALEKKGETVKSAGETMGHSKTFLIHEAEKGNIRRSVSITIEALFGIKPEDYAPDPKPAPEPEKPQVVAEVNTGMNLYDRMALDKASKAIEDLRLTINMHKNQIETLTKVLEQMTEHMAHFDALFGDPMKLYRSIFIPMYNGIRACENDKEAERERKLDGTPKFGR